jgi:hypothetical protein
MGSRQEENMAGRVGKYGDLERNRVLKNKHQAVSPQ